VNVSAYNRTTDGLPVDPPARGLCRLLRAVLQRESRAGALRFQCKRFSKHSGLHLQQCSDSETITVTIY
jgi:hypothetical protein